MGYSPKEFKQRRPDGHGGWIWNTKGVRRVLYGLPEVQDGIADGKVISIAEGEEDVHALRNHGYTATCNDGGAKKWTNAHSEQLRGAIEVVIFGDNDHDGRMHVAQVMRSMQTVGITAHVATLDGLPAKGDIRDWLKDHGQDDLDRLVAGALATTEHYHSVNGNAQAANSLVLTKLADLLVEPEEAVDWLVDGLLPSGGFSLLAAKPKVGKSTLARCLGLAVAPGQVFLGRVTAKGPVIYLALEEKRSEVRKHFHAMGATGEEEIYVYAATAPADALPKIRVVVEEKKPGLLIIDPLFRFTRVKDGNDYAQVTQALEPILALARETGVHVLVVHHLSKGERTGGDAILGSTAILGAVDTSLIMKRSERYRTITSEQHYGVDFEETTLRFDPETRVITMDEAKAREEVLRLKAPILEWLGGAAGTMHRSGDQGSRRREQSSQANRVARAP